MSKKIMEKYSIEEIADSFILTEKLTARQKKEAEKKLKEARKKVQSSMSENERLVSKLLQLKFQMEDYLRSEDFNPDLSFGHFLKEYVGLLNIKRKNFAEEIDIAETELSQLINKHRVPNENILVRLEIHSNNAIPAVAWYKLIEKEKEHSIKTNKELRKQESKYVTNKLSVHLK